MSLYDAPSAFKRYSGGAASSSLALKPQAGQVPFSTPLRRCQGAPYTELYPSSDFALYRSKCTILGLILLL
jgi:hypothetical protein